MTKNGPFFEKNRFCAEKNDFERPRPAKNTFCGYSGNKITYALTEKVLNNPRSNLDFLGLVTALLIAKASSGKKVLFGLIMQLFCPKNTDLTEGQNVLCQ